MQLLRTPINREESVTQNEGRLDMFSTSVFTEFSRSSIQKLIESGAITRNNQRAKKHSPVAIGDSVQLNYVPASGSTGAEIVDENDDYLVVDKPAGVLSTNKSELVDEPSIQSEFGVDGVERLGIVHRLDRQTSGLLLIAKTPVMYKHLKTMFQNRTIHKTYSALLEGLLTDEQVVNKPLKRDPRRPHAAVVDSSGKTAQTLFRPTQAFRSHTLVHALPKTGRTHQIRVHAASIGHPIAGDTLYGGREHELARHFLHAGQISFTLPDGSNVSYTSELPAELTSWLDELQ